jgi:outer membrane protein assembly factor BamE (lipoprotein component of BamABCDE complex)
MARLTKGMTREQVIMAVGYPISDENPSLESNTWRYWLSSFAEFDAIFDDKGLLTRIEGDARTRARVVLE